ncbi:sorbitol ABC transporter membrane protein /mannitol ABC transporter membrane protein [Kushneria avicenniae]|uniref:Sorbitol ABC transporter membrane protein /mannitol ABC transporter membrane protein n=1 Tax=Kushneria avicenniae TaxID=402385 RepID=A0A1I1HMB8_9GAMM|nr:sugar ABC transporter permease [Kushneria avicenniae]SFC24986.1 sorbitol ABC transporter membrane protein /mannitol ABC transporter membrane protein [Kushneria avicenniae]
MSASPTDASPGKRAPTKRLMAPSVLFLLVWMIVPLAMTLYYSFQDYNLMMPDMRGFAGGLSYELLFTDPVFWDALLNTLLLVATCLLVTVVAGLALALLFNRTFVGRGIARTLAISPFFVMPVVTGLIWKYMLLDPVYGLFSWVMRSIGLEPVQWLSSYPLLSVVMMISWEWTPFALLILLTGLQSLPEDQLEAVRLDGANRWQEFRHIVLPHLGQVLYVVIMLESIFFLTSFAEIYATTSGGPGTATTNLPYYIYLSAFFQYDIGLSSAAAIGAVVLANIFAIFLIRFVAGNLNAGSQR